MAEKRQRANPLSGLNPFGRDNAPARPLQTMLGRDAPAAHTNARHRRAPFACGQTAQTLTRPRTARAAAGKAATHGQTPDTRFPRARPRTRWQGPPAGKTHTPAQQPAARASETPRSGNAHARNLPRRADGANRITPAALAENLPAARYPPKRGRASAGKRLRASHARAWKTPGASRGRGRQAKRASPCTRSPETGTAGKPARGQDPRTTSRDFKVQ